MPPCASASGGTEQGGFHTDFAQLYLNVVIILIKMRGVSISGGPAIEQAESVKHFAFKVKTSDHGVASRIHREVSQVQM